MKKPLSERSLVIKEMGEGIPFSDVPGQMRKIIEGWERGEAVTLNGAMSNEAWFSGRIGQQLRIAADFVSGEETEDGDVYYGTATMTPTVLPSFDLTDDGNNKTSFVLRKGKGAVTMQL